VGGHCGAAVELAPAAATIAAAAGGIASLSDEKTVVFVTVQFTPLFSAFFVST
jgi:hypothetical protein